MNTISIDNISHFFIKTYNRLKTRGRGARGEDSQHVYAALRTQSVENKDPSQITGLTACDSKETLQNLLYAYYHIGDIRNSTNHATDEYSGFYTIMADTDPGERVKDISQAIDYFIHCYDRVCEMIAGKEANVVTIRTAELADYAKTIRDAKRHAKAGEGKKQ